MTPREFEAAVKGVEERALLSGHHVSEQWRVAGRGAPGDDEADEDDDSAVQRLLLCDVLLRQAGDQEPSERQARERLNCRRAS